MASPATRGSAARPSRRSPRRLVALLAALATVVASCGSPNQTPAPTAAQPTVWEAITDQFTDGRPGLVPTLQAFAYLYGVDVPGVTIPAGQRGADAPRTGGAVMQWVWSHWAELTAEQRRVIARYSVPQPADVVIDRTGPGPSPGASPTALRAGANAMDTVHAAIGAAAPRAQPSSQTQDAFRNEIEAILAHIGPRLNLPTLELNSLVFSELDGGNIRASTWPCRLMDAEDPNPQCWPFATFGTCNVVIPKNTWSAGTQPSADLRALLTHEVVHCYQNTLWGDLETAGRIPSWMKEGSALWLGANDTGIAEEMVGSQWTKGWFARPHGDLIDRTYDSYPWFALLDHLGRDVWGTIANGWRAAAASPADPSTPFVAALNGDATDVRREWGPSMLNNTTWGPPWTSPGFGVPSGGTVKQAVEIAAQKSGFSNSSYGRGAQVHTVVSVSDEIAVVRANAAMAAAHDFRDGGMSWVGFTSQRFCVKGDCICPKGTQREGERLAEESISIPFVVAFNGGPGSWDYQVSSLSLEDECGKAEPKQPPCGSGCGSSNGDPHLVTVDLRPYDFQAAGEFVLLASPDRALEVQARQEPLPGQRFVSSNTAVALKVAGKRIGAYATKEGMDLRLDGAPLQAGALQDLGQGATLRPYRGGAEVTAPDGTAIFLVSRRNWGINVLVRPSRALRSSAVGLLGTVLSGGLGLPALPDGTRFPRASSGERLRAIYERLGPAWRVTSATSLFDYEPGKTTDSYTVPGFPDLSVIRTPEGLTTTERQAGMGVCGGITDPDLQLQCIFDVVTSGIAEFAELYDLTDTFIRTGTDALQEPPTSAPPGSPPASGSPRPTEALPADVTSLAGEVYLVRGRALGPDGTLYVSLHNLGDTHELIAVDPVTRQVRQRAAMAGSGEIAVAAGTVWVGELPDGYSCAIARVDPASLATTLTIPIPCTIFGPTFAALGDELWYVDPTGTDVNGNGAHLRRLDPATNKPDKAVDLPALNGSLQSSGEALFYTTGDDTAYRLLPGAAAFEPIGVIRGVRFPAHDGIWTEDQDAGGNVAAFHRQTSGPTSTLPIDGPLIGASANGVFVELSDQGTSVLWHVDVAANPVEVLRAPTVPTGTGTSTLSFFDDYPPLTQGNRVVKLWLVASRTRPDAGELLLGSALVP